jgi:hypothetical protein
MLVPKLLLTALILITFAMPIRAVECTDAELLALEVSGELLPPPTMVDQIEEDLASIYAIEPYLAKLGARGDWVPGEILVKITDDALVEYQAGEYHDLDALNATYGLIAERILISSWLHLRFADPYHPNVLGPIYAAVESVINASANGILGDGDDIIVTEIGRYTFKHGWGDCPAGCISAHYWVYTVQGELVQLVAEYGDDFTIASESSSWGSLKSHF